MTDLVWFCVKCGIVNITENPLCPCPSPFISHAVCSRCGQSVVTTDSGEITRHRLPAPKPPIIQDGHMVLGEWCQ